MKFWKQGCRRSLYRRNAMLFTYFLALAETPATFSLSLEEDQGESNGEQFANQIARNGGQDTAKNDQTYR